MKLEEGAGFGGAPKGRSGGELPGAGKCGISWRSQGSSEDFSA